MNADKFTKKSLEAVEGCQRLAMEYNNQEVSSEHLLYSLLTIDDSLIVMLLRNMNIATSALVDEAEKVLTDKYTCLDDFGRHLAVFEHLLKHDFALCI
mgnify:CR=1 FL=1